MVAATSLPRGPLAEENTGRDFSRNTSDRPRLGQQFNVVIEFEISVASSAERQNGRFLRICIANLIAPKSEKTAPESQNRESQLTQVVFGKRRAARFPDCFPDIRQRRNLWLGLTLFRFKRRLKSPTSLVTPVRPVFIVTELCHLSRITNFLSGIRLRTLSVKPGCQIAGTDLSGPFKSKVMASPFKFFRKYSGGMMIVMVILSMLLFTMADLFSDTAANLWLLGLLLGGAVFGIAGIGQGRWLQWGLAGAVLGTALGYMLPGMVSNSGLRTSLGVIGEQEMMDLEMRRAIANQVMIQATEATFGEGTGRFAQLFGFGQSSNRQDVVFGRLLREEADRVGIVVDDSMVAAYLKRATGDKLTTDAYVKIRNNLSYNGRPVDDPLLNSILSDEIKAHMAFQILRPVKSSLPPGPEVYWQYYRRLHVRQQVNVAALDVDEFLEQAGTPSEAEVHELFTQYSEKFPNQDGPGSPGFRQPFQLRLAYVEVDSESVAADVAEVSDEDINKYYEDNKESPLIRTPVIPDLDDDETSDEQSEENVDTTKNAEEEAKSDSEPSDETDDSEPKSEEETDTPKEDASKESGEGKPEPPKEAPPKETPEEEASAEETESEDDSCGADEEADSENTEEESAEPTPATEPEAADESSEESKESAGDKTTTDGEEKPGSEDDASSEPPATPALTIPDAPAMPAAEGDAPKTPEIEYEYRELDDELKEEIRQEIRGERIQQAIDEKMSAAVAEMEVLGRERSRERFARIEKESARFEGRSEEQQEALRELRESMLTFNDGLADRLKTFANENGMAYVETPLVSFADLMESEDYPVGSAIEPNDNPMLAAQLPAVAQTLFQKFSGDEQSNDAQLFIPRRAVLRGAGLDDQSSHYVYWAVDFSLSHVPELEDDGVHDAVVTAWQRAAARALVKERGEGLAEKIRAGLTKEGDDRVEMLATLKGETTTGEEDSTALAVRKSLPFSWLRTSTASPMSFQQQQAVLSPIMFEDAVGGQLELAGDVFMKSVFEDMNDEDVSVVPNADLSKYYVVHVTNRFPTAEAGEDSLLERFATEGQQFAFQRSPILGAMQQQLAGPPARQWAENIWYIYGVDLEGQAAP